MTNQINIVVDTLIKYDNKNNLSWMKVYKETLKGLNIPDTNELLLNVVKEITKRGYDITDTPFKLEKFK